MTSNSAVLLADRLRRVLKVEISRQRRTWLDMSQAIGMGRDYVGKILRGDIQLTVEHLQLLADVLGVPVPTLVSRASPDEASACEPLDPESRLTLCLASDSLENQRYLDFVRYSPRPAQTSTNCSEPSIDRDMFYRLDEMVHVSIDRAIDHITFWLEELIEHRGYPAQYICCLAALASSLRSTRRPCLNDAALLLIRAFRLLGEHPCPAASAFVHEKAARLLWDLARPDDCIKLLERAELVHHPQQDTLHAVRGAFYFYRGEFSASLACFDIAERLTSSHTCLASAIDMRSQILAQQGDAEAAFTILAKAEGLTLPEILRHRLRWTEARLLAASGDPLKACSIYTSLAVDSPIRGQPQLAAYLLREFFDLEPTTEFVEVLGEAVQETLNGLDLANPIEKALWSEIRALRGRYTNADPRFMDRRSISKTS